MPFGRLLVSLVLACAGTTVAVAQERLPENLVKAAFLSRFGSFVDWPAGTFPTPQTSVQLCVVGRDPFGDVLERASQGQTVAMHPITIRRLNAITPNSGCHIAYLGGSPEQSVAAAARTLADAPVLTVAEAPNAERAMIQFVVTDSHVRFRIDQRNGASARLIISSKLLNLATEVVR